MSRVAAQAESLDQRVEVVTTLAGKEHARQPHRAEHRRREAITKAAELVAQEAVVESGVVRNEDAAIEAAANFAAQVLEARRSGDQMIVDAGELRDRGRDAATRVDETAPLLHHPAVIEQHDADLDDAVVHRGAAGGLEVDTGQRPAQADRLARVRADVLSARQGGDRPA